MGKETKCLAIFKLKNTGLPTEKAYFHTLCKH